jgi:outer membrane protein TolC
MAWTARLVVGAAVFGLATTARADHTLTLDDALALARVHNRDLRAGRARLSSSEAGIAQARAALLPYLSTQGKYTHNYKEVTFNFATLNEANTALAQTIESTTNNPVEAAALQNYINQANAAVANATPIEIQLLNQFDGYLNGSVPLIAPSSWYSLASARATARSSEANYDVTEASVLVSVAQAFFAAAGTDELVVARQHAVQVADETYQFAKARVGSDLANPVDVTRAETALVRAQQDLAEADNQRATAYRSLATMIDVHDPIRVVPPTVQPAEPAAMPELVRGAMATRPEITQQRTAIDAARASSRAYAWRWAPSLSAFGNAHAGNYTGFSGDKTSWAVGLQLDWILYDGGARDAQRQIANAQRDEAEAKLDLAHDQIADEVANARGTLETKRKGVVAADRAVVLAKESLRIVRAQYEAGTVKQLDVLQAQDSLVSAEVNLAQAHFDLSLADLQLQRAAGTFPGRHR